MLDSLIAEDHLARMIRGFVQTLDLSELENRIKARGSRPGHPATTPRLLLALWLYAASQGVSSARALARLCERLSMEIDQATRTGPEQLATRKVGNSEEGATSIKNERELSTGLMTILVP
jgi:hypothetical protein